MTAAEAHRGPSASRTADVEECHTPGDATKTNNLGEPLTSRSVPLLHVSSCVCSLDCERLVERDLSPGSRNGVMGKFVFQAIIVLVLLAIAAPCVTFYLLLKVGQLSNRSSTN